MTQKRVLVTGASRGLGRAIASLLAQNGNLVGVNFLTSLDSAETLAREYPENITLLNANIRDSASVFEAVGLFARKHGGIDVVVNNAGVHHPGLLIKKPIEHIRDEIETNLYGPTLVSKAALPFMLKQRSGLLLSISSVAADHPRPGLAVYSASKAGLEAFTRGIALEYKSRGIRALCLRFGPIQTDMLAHLPEEELRSVLSRTLMGRAASAEEAAEHVFALMRDNSSMQTGSILTFDSGYSLGAD